MKNFVYKYTEHRLRSNTAYVNSYRFESPSGTTQYFNYYARYLFPQHNEITTNDNRVITLDPSIEKSPNNEVVFCENNEPIAIYDIDNKVIFDKRHQPLVYLVDTRSLLKTALSTAVQANPGTYLLMDKTKNIRYGHIRRTKIGTRLFWPLSIIENIIRVITTAKSLYEIEFTSPAIEKEILMVISVILEEMKPSSQAAT